MTAIVSAQVTAKQRDAFDHDEIEWVACPTSGCKKPLALIHQIRNDKISTLYVPHASAPAPQLP